MSSMTFFRTCSNFYKPQPLHTLEESRTDILVLERETEGCWRKLLGRSHPAILTVAPSESKKPFTD